MRAIVNTIITVMLLVFTTSTLAADLNLVSWVKLNHVKSEETDVSLVITQVDYYASINRLDRNLLLAIISRESGFNQKARYAGANGLMQVQKNHHVKIIAGRNIMDPKVNIDVGSKILKACELRAKGNLSKTLACYSGRTGKTAAQYVADIKKRMSAISQAAKTTGGQNG